MFNSSNKSGSVQEDALMTVSTLAEVMGDGFIKYIEAFKPYLLMGLKNITEHQVIRDLFTLLYLYMPLNSILVKCHESSQNISCTSSSGVHGGSGRDR